MDVIVPVHGNWPITRVCLSSLAAQTLDHHVILIDDASPDDTRTRVAEEFPEVEVIALDRNRGFAAACNHGFRAATAAIVVLVNNDVVAGPTMLEKLIAPFDDARVGSSSPVLLRPDGRIDAFGICADVTLAGFQRLHGALDTPDPTPRSRLLGPYGAVAAYRASAVAGVGLLDEGIFMYGEELDLALRLSAAGWVPAAAPEARGVHLGGATTGRGSRVQRQRSGFGRGYLLRAYDVLAGRHAARALLTELVVSAGDAVLSRDFAAFLGRVEGWRAGKTATSRSRRIPDVDGTIGFVASLSLRVGSRS